MSDPYPPITRWLIPDRARDATLWGLRRAGQRGREGGALWLGERTAAARVVTVASAVGDGVIEGAGSWSLSPTAYARIGDWAFKKGRVLLALVHSHGGTGPLATMLSPTDRFSTVQVPDFLSVVVGKSGNELDPEAWGYHLFDDGHFRHMEKTEVVKRITWVPAEIEHVRFDANAVTVVDV